MKKIQISVLILVFFSCNSENKKESFFDKSIDKLISDKIIVEDNNFNKIFTLNSKIQLNTDKNSPITEIAELCVTKTRYIVADRRGKQLLLFDKNGNIEKSIGEVGKGPGEFMRVASIDINNNNEILLLDSKNWRVSKFKMDGKFVNSFEVMAGSYILADLNDGFYLYRPLSKIKAVDVNLITHYNSDGENDFSFCKPFFEFGLGDGSIHKDKHGNLYMTQIFSSSVHKYSPQGKYLAKVGNENKYYKSFRLKRDKELPPIEEIKKCTQVQGFAINSKYILIQLNNYDIPYNFNWIDIYDVKGNLLMPNIKIPKGFQLSDVGDDDLFYFIYLPTDDISLEVPNYYIIGYVIVGVS